MPNWVTHIITLEGNKKQIEALKKHVHTKESEFDFNKIIPVPKELMVEGSDMYAKEFLEKYKNAPMKEIIDERLDQSIEYFLYEKECAGNVMTAKEITDTKQMVHNYFKHGYVYWYDWQIDHWGVKWGADGASVSDECITFNTAWSTPEPVIIALSKLYPKVIIKVDYADEDLGSNCGTYTCINGRIDRDGFSGDHALKFACDLWGRDYDELMEERNQDS
jgi:hypothetical protein